MKPCNQRKPMAASKTMEIFTEMPNYSKNLMKRKKKLLNSLWVRKLLLNKKREIIKKFQLENLVIDLLACQTLVTLVS